MKSFSKNTLPALPIVGVVIFGLALRLVGLWAQSFWSDEVGSILAAEKSPVWVLLKFILFNDISPPLFYLVLKPWCALVDWIGPLVAPEFSYRALSVIFGVWAIGLTYQLGARVSKKSVGLLAAALLALYPLHVYFSRELRYPAMLTVLALGSTISFLTWLKDDKKRLPWGYMLLTTAGLYTHYFFVFLLAGQWAAVVFAPKTERTFVSPKFIRAQVLIGAAFLPGLFMAVIQFLKGNAFIKFIEQDLPLGTLFTFAVNRLLVGHSPKRPVTWWVFDSLYESQLTLFLLCFAALTLPLVVLTIYGCSRLIKGAMPARTVAWTALSAMGAQTFLYLIAAKLDVKLIVWAAPFLMICISAGSVALYKRHRVKVALALLLTIFLWGVSLYQAHTDPRYFRDNWRGLSGFIETHEKPGDGLANFSFETEYYFDGDSKLVPMVDLRARDFAAQGFALTPDQVTAKIDALVTGHDRLWIRNNPYPQLGWVEDLIDGVVARSVDISPPLLDRFGIGARLVVTNVDRVEDEIVEVAKSTVDFSGGLPDRRLLEGLWLPTNEGWAWTTNSSAAWVRPELSQNAVRADVFVNVDLFPQNRVNVQLLLNDRIVDSRVIDRSCRIGLLGKISEQGKGVRVKIRTDKIIYQDTNARIAPDSARTVLLRKIECFFLAEPAL